VRGTDRQRKRKNGEKTKNKGKVNKEDQKIEVFADK